MVWPTLWHSYLDRSAHTSGNGAKAFIFLKRKSERPVEESVVFKREGEKKIIEKSAVEARAENVSLMTQTMNGSSLATNNH